MKKRLSFTLFITFLFSMLTFTFVFASSQVQIPSTIDSQYVYSNPIMVFSTSDTQSYLVMASGFSSKFYVNSSSPYAMGCNGNFLMYSKSGSGNWTYLTSGTSSSNISYYNQVIPASFNSNCNVYTSSSYTNVFFYQFQLHQHLPLLQTILQTLPKQIISLVPLLVPLLAGFLALRKGLQLLLQVLHQA